MPVTGAMIAPCQCHRNLPAEQASYEAKGLRPVCLPLFGYPFMSRPLKGLGGWSDSTSTRGRTARRSYVRRNARHHMEEITSANCGDLLEFVGRCNCRPHPAVGNITVKGRNSMRSARTLLCILTASGLLAGCVSISRHESDEGYSRPYRYYSPSSSSSGYYVDNDQSYCGGPRCSGSYGNYGSGHYYTQEW